MRKAILYFLLVAMMNVVGVARSEVDELDDVLRVEEMAAGETLSGEDEAAGRGELAGEVESGETVSVQDPAALGSLSREELIDEVLHARSEVERMKDIVRRILAANRREKEIMHYNIGCVFRDAGHYRKAEQSFLEALRLNPRDPAVHYNLGILYDEDLQQPAKAKKHYEAFLELAPEDKDAGQVYQWLTAID